MRFAFLPRFGPYLLAPLLFTFTSDRQAIVDGYSRYVAFLILFLGWEVLLKTLIRVRLRKETEDKSSLDADLRARQELAERKLKKKKRAAAEAALGAPPQPVEIRFSRRQKFFVALAIVVMLFAMEIFRGYFEDSIFFLLLATLTCGVLGELWGRRTPGEESKFLRSLTPKLLYLTGIGYIGCLAIHGELQHQPLVLASGMAAMALVPTVFDELVFLSGSSSQEQSPQTSRRYLQRALALLVVFGPLSAALLVYSGQLPMSYLLVFLSLGVGSRLLQRVPRNGEPVDGDLEWLSILTSVVFLGVFLLLRML